VLSPEDAARQFGADAVFVIAVWHPVAAGGVREIAGMLQSMGCARVVSFVPLFWKFSQEFLPYYLWDLPQGVLEDGDAVRRAFALFEGARSQAEFLRQVELRLTGDFALLKTPDAEPQYFPPRLFRPREDECFVDCGAYNGDSLRDFVEWTGGKFRKAIAFEADPENFAALNRTVEADARLRGRVEAIAEAVGGERCTLRFEASGQGNAAISALGGIEVQCTTLDEALGDEQATYIKMDIEGAELDALTGGSRVLRRDTPSLAICAYHLQDHLWKVPARISGLLPSGRLLLRPHCMDGFDLVCYAIPPGREIDLGLEDDL
jgi:FkbM family methyltransferase